MAIKTRGEQIQAGIDAGFLREVPGLVQLLEAHEAIAAQIIDSPYNTAEQARRLAAAEQELREKVDALVQAATTSATRDLDQAEGRARAEAANGRDAADVAARASVFVTSIEAADPDAVLSAFNDAEFTGRPEVIRIVGLAARARLRELATKAPGITSPAQIAYLTFQERFAPFERANPTPRQRVAQIERERHNVATAIAESAKFALKRFNVGTNGSAQQRRPAPATASPGRLVFGEAWDILADRHARR